MHTAHASTVSTQLTATSVKLLRSAKYHTHAWPTHRYRLCPSHLVSLPLILFPYAERFLNTVFLTKFLLPCEVTIIFLLHIQHMLSPSVSATPIYYKSIEISGAHSPYYHCACAQIAICQLLGTIFMYDGVSLSTAK